MGFDSSAINPVDASSVDGIHILPYFGYICFEFSLEFWLDDDDILPLHYTNI